jgi:hypothetical protein
MSGIHRGLAMRDERNHRAVARARWQAVIRPADPELRCLSSTLPRGPGLSLAWNSFDTERFQHRIVKGEGPRQVVRAEHHVAEHRSSPCLGTRRIGDHIRCRISLREES